MARKVEKEFDFRGGRRGPVLPHGSKKRITIWLDADVLEWFGKNAEKEGKGYQTIINESLRGVMKESGRSLADIVKKAVREGMKSARKAG